MPLISAATSPDTLGWGRLPDATADPREIPSPNIPHACPHGREDDAGTSPAASSPGHWGTKPCSCWGNICHLQRGGVQQHNAPILVGNASSGACKGDRVHSQGDRATSSLSHTAPILAKSLKGSASALTGDAGGMEGYSSAALFSPGRPLCLQSELAPGASPAPPLLLPVPFQHLRSSHITRPSPGNAVVSFYSCPAIIFSQLRITLAKSLGSFHCSG